MIHTGASPSEISEALAKGLGLPVENLIGFTLECRAGHYPELKAEYLVRSAGHLRPAIERYELRPVLMQAHEE